MAGRRQRWFGVAAIALFLAGQAFAAIKVDLDGSGWTFKTTLEERASMWLCRTVGLLPSSIANTSALPSTNATSTFPPPDPGKVVRLHFDAVYD